MIAIVHDNGVAVSKVSKFDMAYDITPQGARPTPYIQAENVYNIKGMLLQGDRCEIVSGEKELIGEVSNVGAIITRINILGETTGIKDKINKWLKEL